MASANFIYFDGSLTYGALNGVVQVELSANTLDPSSDGAVNLGIEPVGRLRCSIQSAEELIDSLTKAVEMAKKPRSEPPQTNARN